MRLDEIAAELYGLPPEDFTAVRNQRAKEARAGGDRDLAAAVQKLRKPSTSAWALNLFAREAPEELGQLLGLGAQLREAADALDGEELRELTRRRHQLVTAVARQVRTLARDSGRPLSDAIVDEVEDTLRAAMADPGAAEAVQAGQLTTALSSTGLAPVPLTRAVAVPPPSRPATTAPTRKVADEVAARRRLAEARTAADEAAGRARAAREQLDRAEGRVAELAARRQQIADELAELTRRMRDLEQDAAAAEQDERAARSERDTAHRQLATAEREERRAADRLDRLR